MNDYTLFIDDALKTAKPGDMITVTLLHDKVHVLRVANVRHEAGKIKIEVKEEADNEK